MSYRAESSFQSSPGFSTGCNRPTQSAQPPCPNLFQSSPGFSTGCNLSDSSPSGPPTGFNPHPASQPDATGAGPGCGTGWGSFNPHPASQPDATGAGPGCGTGWGSFNPHPASQPDATDLARASWYSRKRFNPHPASQPDATPVSDFPICSPRTSTGRPSDVRILSVLLPYFSYGSATNANPQAVGTGALSSR